MNVNNQCYKMFELMKHGYDTENHDEMEQGARCWLDFSPENPFEYDSDEMEAFFQMQRCYKKWRSGGIDHKINRRKMIMWTEMLCSLNPENPYKFDKKAEEEDIRAKKEQYKQTLAKEKTEIKAEKVVLDEPVKIMNAMPEDKKGWLKNMFSKKKEGVQDDSSGAN